VKRALTWVLGALVATGLAVPPAVAESAHQSAVGAATDVAPPATSAAESAESGESGVVVALLRDIAGDYKHFISKETAGWLGLGGAAAAVVHAADDSIADWTQEHNASLPGGNYYGSQWLHIPVAIGWWVTAAAAGSARHADTGRDLLRAQISVVSWTYAIKLTAQRTRPNGDPHSFPSGHASTSFATAMVLQQHYGWKLGLPAFLAATYTGVSRVYDNQHWASDVVFGAAVGMASGRTVTIHLRDSAFALGPLAVPGGGGVLVTALRKP
jgi:membrane-associated phospholipid phosphatase